MDKIIPFIVDNKEWVFSGIGVFVLGGIVTFIKKILPKKKEKNNTSLTMTQTVENGGTGTQIGTQNNYYGEKEVDHE